MRGSFHLWNRFFVAVRFGLKLRRYPKTVSGTNEVFVASVRPKSAGQRKNVDISDIIGVDVILGDRQWRQKDWRERLKLNDENHLGSAGCGTA